MANLNINNTYNNVASYYSADGSLFVLALLRENGSYPGKDTPNGFEVVCLRSTDNGNSYKRVLLPEVPKGQFNVSIEPDGMFITFDDNGKARRIQVPGFINPLAHINGTIEVSRPPIVQQINDPNINYKLNQFETRIKDLEKKTAQPVANTSGVTEQRVAEIAWQKIEDYFWGALNNPGSALILKIGEIAWQKAMDAIFVKFQR